MILLNKLYKVYNWQVKRDKSTTTCALMEQMGSFKHSEALEKDIIGAGYELEDEQW